MNSDIKEKLIPVARISKPFGTGGELAINLYDTFPADFEKGESLFALVDSLPVPLFAEKFEKRGRSGALVSFMDIDTPVRAAEFLGKELLLMFSAETGNVDGDEVYFEDMVGFSARFTGNDLKGTIMGFVDSEHNPLFTLSVNGKEVFVPAAEEMIAGFDVKRKVVTFDLPEGLLELYL